MQFKFSFSVLLVGVLVAISTQNAQALPLAKHSAGMVTLSLNAVKRSGADIHPQIVSRCTHFAGAVANFGLLFCSALSTTHEPWSTSPGPYDWACGALC